LPEDKPQPKPEKVEAHHSKNIDYIPCPHCGQSAKRVPCDYCGGSGFVEILRDF